jgi:hypothetical protein
MHAEWVLTNLCWFWMQVRDQIAWSFPSLISGLLACPSTPFSAGSQEWPPSPNFPQFYIVEPSSGFNKGFRSTSVGDNKFCRNLSLGLTTKARACEGASQEWGLRVTFHTPKNVGDCEGMNLHIPKWAPILGVGVLMDSQIFREQFQGSKPIGLKSSLYKWKDLGM